jgi:serine/threonine-protein kinase
MSDSETQTQLQSELAPDFQIVRLLGEGSMANVYLARETALTRMVAIKVMKSQLAGDEIARKRFEREARSAAKIHHHNVATVHRVGTMEDETPYIVMEHIEGRNLDDALQAEGAMAIDQACHVLSQVASALAAAHENGIVHRDVKPANVVRERDSERVVLTDFGIAGILDTGADSITRITQQGQLLGDPRYMSPEQLLGEPLTDESDVYSLGILAYEVLTLKHAYPATSKVQIATAHLEKAPIPLRDLRPDADPQLGELLARCLAKKPMHRPRASEVAKALDALSGRPNAEGGPGSRSSGDVILPVAVQNIPALQNFLGELRRRHVYNVAVFYVLIAGGVLGAADLTLESLPVPENTHQVLVALALGGFPLALVIAWMFDITSKGVRRTESVLPKGARAKMLVLQAVFLGTALILSGLIAWWALGG